MSEHTSPLHDPSAQTVPVAASPRFALPRVRLAAWDDTTVRVAAALTVILLLSAFLRFTYNKWDANSGPWDQSGNQPVSGHLHPDERFLTQIEDSIRAPGSIAQYFNTDTSPLNPYNIKKPEGGTQTTFVYGTLPLFLNKIVATQADVPYKSVDTLTFGNGDAVNSALRAVSFGRIALPVNTYDSYDGYNLSGRWLSALFDVGTVALAFALGAALANRRVGLLAAFLYAMSAFAIQNAHFFVVDPFVAFFATFTVLFAVKSAKDGGYRNFALAGVGAGLAAASKITAISLIPVTLLGVGVYAWPGISPYLAPWWDGDREEFAARRNGRALDRSILTLVLGSLVALVAAFIAFRIAMPYAFKTPSLSDVLSLRAGRIGPFPFPYPDIMNRQWIKDQADQQRLLSGNAAFPPNVQWIGRSRWLWPMQQMVMWGMGPALGITAWLGVLFVAVEAWRKRAGMWLVPLAWVLGYFGFMGAQFSLYMRYFLPLYPTLTVFAAFALYQAWRWGTTAEPLALLGTAGRQLRSAMPALTLGARAGVVVVIAMTALFGIAFYRIYMQPVTRVTASKWFYENVPEGATVGHEEWDDNVPYAISGVPPVKYNDFSFKNFQPDSPESVATLLDEIDRADYIALASARLSGTITRVPAIYPVTSAYYRALEDGSLGFEKVAQFKSFPNIFGVRLDDTAAEESYSVYDHPQVTIYKKTSAYSAERTRLLLRADAFVTQPNTLPGNAGQNNLLFRPDVLKTQQAGGTFSDIFNPNSVMNRFPLFFWLLTIEIAAFALVPLAVVGFRGLPDRGFLLTKPLGVLVLSYLAYAPASRGALQFTRAEIAGGLALLAAVGVVTAVLWRREVLAFVRERWRFLLFAEAVFLLAFLAAYWVRLQNPDLWHPYNGGEKPMDLAYFTAVTRSTDLTQGPIDPWNSGGYLNYYWYGQFISATITKLTGIMPEVAYNLLIPMFFALTAAATFSLTYNLTEGTRRMLRRSADGRRISLRGPLLAALLAVFLVLIAGNLRALDVLEKELSRQSSWHLNAPFFGGVVAIVGGFKEVLFGDGSFRRLVFEYDWWAPSRALGIEPTTKNNVTPITEFPFWTFLFADLHAHLMALPFSMTAVGVGFGAVSNFTRLNPTRRRSLAHLAWSNWALVVLLGLIVGSLRWINSWDYPPFLLMAAAALLIAERAKYGRFSLKVVGISVLKVAIMGALSFAFFAPFSKNYSQAYNGFHQSDQTTAVGDYLSQFGILLTLVSGLIVFGVYRALRNSSVRSIFFGDARRRPGIGRTTLVMASLAAAAALAIAAASMERWGVTALAAVGLIAVLVAAWREFRNPAPHAPILLFVYSMIALGLGLTGGVEVLTLDGDIGRMNTVFKFYLHVWLLWGVSGAFASWYIFAVARPQQALLRRAGDLHLTLVRVPRYAFAATAVVLVALSLVYPYFGLRARIHNRFDPTQAATNDGLAFLDSGVIYTNKDDRTGLGGDHNLAYTRDGINWLRANVQGMPTFIEAIGPSYRSLGSRVSIYTGFPTVSGYGFHQAQQRAKFSRTVDERQRDVAEFYSTTDVSRARELLRKYDVSYVIVGDEERFNYPAEGLAKFDGGLGGSLEKLYENPGFQVWRVIPLSELARTN